jgi:hypothetical protein
VRTIINASNDDIAGGNFASPYEPTMPPPTDGQFFRLAFSGLAGACPGILGK